MRRTREYWVWADMKGRCQNPGHAAFANYGGRGIAVCDRWQSFAGFAEDMLPRPEGGMLDRIDNSGPYAPDNCRWTDRKTQNSNRRNCIFVAHGDERVTLREYCRREGLAYRPIVKRIQDRNWPIEQALTVPVGSGKQYYRNPEKADA
jgi:hypothetical protein